SPARTVSPLWTLIVASWPATSGAMRTSVVRTTPMTGGVGSGRDSQYAPAPIAITTRPSTTMRFEVELAKRLPPLHQKRGDHRQRKIDDREAPESAPIADHLPQAGAQLIDAHYTVDRKI